MMVVDDNWLLLMIDDCVVALHFSFLPPIVTPPHLSFIMICTLIYRIFLNDISSTHTHHQVIFEDPVIHARRCINLLHHQHHCNLILALTHVELITDELIAELDGVDIIIGGHEHTPFHYTHQGTTIIKCGQNIDHLGVLDLHFTRCLPSNTYSY